MVPEIFVVRERSILTHLSIRDGCLVVDDSQATQTTSLRGAAVVAARSDWARMVILPDAKPRTFHFLSTADDDYLLRPGHFLLSHGGVSPSWGPGLAIAALLNVALRPTERRRTRTVRAERQHEAARFVAELRARKLDQDR